MKCFETNIDCLTLNVKQAEYSYKKEHNYCTEQLSLSKEIKICESVFCSRLKIKIPNISNRCLHQFQSIVNGISAYTNIHNNVKNLEYESGELEYVRSIRHRYCVDFCRHILNGESRSLSPLNKMLIRLGSLRKKHRTNDQLLSKDELITKVMEVREYILKQNAHCLIKSMDTVFDR